MGGLRGQAERERRTWSNGCAAGTAPATWVALQDLLGTGWNVEWQIRDRRPRGVEESDAAGAAAMREHRRVPDGRGGASSAFSTGVAGVVGDSRTLGMAA